MHSKQSTGLHPFRKTQRSAPAPICAWSTSAQSPGDTAAPPPAPQPYLGQVVAEAEPAAAVQTELAQGCHAGCALSEATGVISLDGSRDQGLEVLLARQIYGRVP